MSHPSEAALATQLAAAGRAVAVGRLYAHYKHPDQTYRVTGFAILEATEEVAVIYQAQYGRGVSFVRALSSWHGIVSVGGRPQPRFHTVN